MDEGTAIRILSGVVAILIVGIIIWRRKREAMR
jgi:LPXTG-motif cell wall-anchored protein